MRYADGGGLTGEGRARRQDVRLQAARLFEQDLDARRIATILRVSAKSVYQWRRAWRAGGDVTLASRGPGGSGCKLDEQQLARLRAALDAGPAAYGWDRDQQWTLARVAALIARLSGVSYTLRGTSYLLHWLGYSPQVPVRRAAERDEAKIAGWRSQTWTKAGSLAATGAWICFEDESGQALRPPVARTWGRRRHTPVVRVSGRGSGRISVAGLACFKAGQPGRFSCRMRGHQLRPGTRRAMTEADYAALITAAHRYLDAPVIVIWDNLSTHLSRKMRAFTTSHPDWLTVIQLPAYAPGPNPV